MTLDEIGQRYQTDKSSILHDYLKEYERLFGARKDSFTSILEIGIYHGASLRTWKHWCPQAAVIGVDNWRDIGRHEVDGCVVETADVSRFDQIAEIAQRHGPFDLIVDDGSHIIEHQVIAHAALWPHLKPGGYYVIEDIPKDEVRFPEMRRVDGTNDWYFVYGVKP